MAIKKAMIPLMNKDLVNGLNKGVTVSELGFTVDDYVHVGEDLSIDGDLNMNGSAINFNGVKLGVKEGRFGIYFRADEWTYAQGAYTADTLVAEGVTADSIVTNGWEEEASLPMTGNDGEIWFSANYGFIVLFHNNKKYYTSTSTKKLKLAAASYDVIKYNYPGYTPGLTEEEFKPFAFEN